MEERNIDTMTLDGGWLCLDFINTVHDRTVETPFDYLSSYLDLLDWSVKVEIMNSSEKEELVLLAQENEADRQQALQQVIEAREVFYKYFLSIAQDEVPGDSVQNQFNALLSNGLQQLKLRVIEGLAVRHVWQSPSDLRYPLYPVIKSAYDLMTSDLLDRVKECGACGWLFLDKSKNRSRKWCSMESCGSNVKAKRYYHRHKKKK